MSRWVALTMLAVSASSAQIDERFRLPEGCRLPFEAIAIRRTIDETCGPEGSASSERGRAQNRAKNDFCAEGPARILTVDDLVRLHGAVGEAGIPYGDRGLPDRAGLAAVGELHGEPIGEGARVRVVGFVDRTYYARVERGESVNCRFRGETNNDIHIELAERVGSGDRCRRISAEVSPHFRPAAWNVAALRQVRSAEHPLRVSGQLFFDASHGACADGRDWRGSSWEVHPVYGLDVCRFGDLADCDAADEGVWVPLHEWEGPGPAD